MLRVGLTGGIGSGKSEVARRLAEHGAVVIDSDEIARAVVEPGTPGLDAVVTVFGPEVLTPDGRLDRDRLAAVVFADEAARVALNGIVHPLVAEESRRRLAQVPDDAIVVHDVPLLVEVGMACAFDVVVVVAATPEAQLRRLVECRGMSAEAAQARIDAQLPLAEKVAVADIVVPNDGDLSGLAREVDALWAELVRRARA